jgi:transcription elongation factor Elf1
MSGNMGAKLRRKLMDHHTPPRFQAEAFNCPLCGAYSKQIWLDAQRHYPTGAAIAGKELRIAQCTRCNKLTFWLDGKMLPGAPESAAFPNPE